MAMTRDPSPARAPRPGGEAGKAARFIPLAAFALGMAAVAIPAQLFFPEANAPQFILAKLAAGALAGMVAWYLARAYAAGGAAASRTSLAGALAWIGMIAALILVLETNYVSARHWARTDWTSSGFYSLSDKSKGTLADLAKPVKVIVFLSPRSEVYADLYKDLLELLSQMQDESKQLTVEYVDPDRDLEKAETLIEKYKLPPDADVVVFESGEKVKYVTGDEMAEYDYAGDMGMGAPSKTLKGFKGEEAFLSALLEVTSDVQTEICFTKGHGEASSTDMTPNSLAGLAETLSKLEALKTSDFDPSTTDVPATCTVVVVAGPETPYLPAETARIDAFLAKGGKLLALFDPPLDDPTAGRKAKTGFEELLARWGVTVDRAVAIDPENLLSVPGASGLEAAALRVVDWGGHAIVKPFAEGLPAVFRLSRPVIAMNPPPAGIEVHELMHTSKEGWGERSSLAGDKIGPDPEDLKGPVPLGVAVDAPTHGGARLVVFGNSRFAGNMLMTQGVNYDLFLNSVRWLTKKEKLISIAPKSPEKVSLDLGETQMNLVFWSSVVVLPFLSVLCGVLVWGVRRFARA